mgnify:CR=1 FL=1
MATINKRNGKYCVIYYYVDTKGKKRQKWEHLIQFLKLKLENQ